MMRRLGDSAANILVMQSNLAITYTRLGRYEEALSMRQENYSGRRELNGEEHEMTLLAANNLVLSLLDLERFEEVRSLLREMMPVAQRVLGESNSLTLKLRRIYAQALYRDPGATLDDLREAVTTFEDVERVARRVLGGQHPFTRSSEKSVRVSRATLSAREDAEPDVSAQDLDAAEAAAAGDGSG